MSKYIIETATGAARRTICDVETLTGAHAACAVAMSKARQEGGPDFAFAVDEDGHWRVVLERTQDGRILDHLNGAR